MILFDLRCAKGHVFEAWFKDGAAYERQVKRGQILCPECGARKVAKSPMAPKLAGHAGAEAPGGVERRAKALKTIDAVRDHIERNFDPVGAQFPEEARRIHYGEARKRNIYGDATLKDAWELHEEGIGFGILPRRRRTDS
jgi:hypothetical protein